MSAPSVFLIVFQKSREERQTHSDKVEQTSKHQTENARCEAEAERDLTYNKLFADEVFTASPPLAGADVRGVNIAASQSITLN